MGHGTFMKWAMLQWKKGLDGWVSGGVVGGDFVNHFLIHNLCKTLSYSSLTK
jgi:hypothetical protein